MNTDMNQKDYSKEDHFGESNSSEEKVALDIAPSCLKAFSPKEQKKA